MLGVLGERSGFEVKWEPLDAVVRQTDVVRLLANQVTAGSSAYDRKVLPT